MSIKRKQIQDILATVDPNIAEVWFEQRHRPPMQWTVLNAIHFQKKTFEELASETGYAIGTLKEHYSKAVTAITSAYLWQAEHEKRDKR